MRARSRSCTARSARPAATVTPADGRRAHITSAGRARRPGTPGRGARCRRGRRAASRARAARRSCSTSSSPRTATAQSASAASSSPDTSVAEPVRRAAVSATSAASCSTAVAESGRSSPTMRIVLDGHAVDGADLLGQQVDARPTRAATRRARRSTRPPPRSRMSIAVTSPWTAPMRLATWPSAPGRSGSQTRTTSVRACSGGPRHRSWRGP